MTKLTLEKDIIVKRIAGIESELLDLEKLSKLKFEEFENGDGWKLAQFHLYRAIEGVINISSHILSRIQGVQITKYSEIAVFLGEKGIVDKDFANENLSRLIKYRNRLAHFYAEIKPPELYKIINENLKDFETFLKAVKKVLENPNNFGLSVE